MNRFNELFEKGIIWTLIIMMMGVVILATVDLGWNIIQDVLSPPLFLLEVSELLDIFGYIMLVIIGLELLETIRAYLKEHDDLIHVQVVINVALIAIGRKVIILDYKKTDTMTLFGIAAIIVALTFAFYFTKRIRHKSTLPPNANASVE